MGHQSMLQILAIIYYFTINFTTHIPVRHWQLNISTIHTPGCGITYYLITINRQTVKIVETALALSLYASK
jgi:hypothetical protein